MKKKVLFTLFAALAVLQINAQCERSGSFVQSDPQYFLSGDAKVLFMQDGSKKVIFEENFTSVQGANLRVFVSTTQDILAPGASIAEVTTGQLVSDDGTTSPPLRPLTGMKTFDFPAGSGIDDYDYIVIQCTTINEPWGYASLGSPSAGCATLSTDENKFSKNISLYPNPANDEFEVRNELQTPVSIAVYSVLGKQVQFIENSQLKKQKVSLSNLNSGVYLVEIKSDTNRIIKKLIKR